MDAFRDGAGGDWIRVRDVFGHAVLLDPSGRFAFVPHTGPNAIFQFSFDAKSGELCPAPKPKLTTAEKTGPRHLVFHPKGEFAFVDNEQGVRVTVTLRRSRD